jgi:large subunit ribosomal protein L5
MHFLEHYYKKIIKQDLINKFNYKTVDKIPKIKKIILNFGCKNFSVQKVAKTLLAMELITTRKGTITIAQKANILLKIQKGYPAGCKVVLTKTHMYRFLAKLLIEILPKIKDFSTLKINIKKNIFSFKLNSSNLILKELEEQYPLFSDLSDLDINIQTNTQTQSELLFLVKSFKLYIFSIKN